MALTDDGRTRARARSDIRTVNDLHQAWYQQLGGPRARLLQVLISCYPSAISREELGERTGYSPSSGNLANLLGSLRTLGLVDYPASGQVVATALLFPELPTTGSAR